MFVMRGDNTHDWLWGQWLLQAADKYSTLNAFRAAECSQQSMLLLLLLIPAACAELLVKVAMAHPASFHPIPRFLSFLQVTSVLVIKRRYSS